METSVLWFTPIPPRAALLRLGKRTPGTGFWIHAAQELLKDAPLRLGVCYCDEHGEAFESEGVKYFPLKQPNRYLRALLGDQAGEATLLRQAKEVVDEFNPEVIHVHGVEAPFGLLKSRCHVEAPIVVSMQGLMGPCAETAWGNRHALHLLPHLGLWDIVRGGPAFRLRSSFRRRHVRELTILRSVAAVMGRTEFDRSYAAQCNPMLRYFHCDEVMRPEFYIAKWEAAKATPHTLFCAGRLSFQKGTHVLLDALAIVRRRFPQVRLRLAGELTSSCEHKYLRNQIKRLDLDGAVTLLGWLSVQDLLLELQQASLYVSPSFMENSSNSIAEAMLLGMPIVASSAGGTPSMLHHGSCGLLYEAESSGALASRLMALLENRNQAMQLGAQARIAATTRHDCGRIKESLLSVYKILKSLNI